MWTILPWDLAAEIMEIVSRQVLIMKLQHATDLAVEIMLLRVSNKGCKTWEQVGVVSVATPSPPIPPIPLSPPLLSLRPGIKYSNSEVW